MTKLTKSEKASKAFWAKAKKLHDKKKKKALHFKKVSEKLSDPKRWKERFGKRKKTTIMGKVRMSKTPIDSSEDTVYVPLGNLALPASIASKLDADAAKTGNRAKCVRKAICQYYGYDETEEF